MVYAIYILPHNNMLTFKNAQLWYVDFKKIHDVRVASLIWGKMRTAAQETASQVALRNCPKEAGGVIWVKGKYMQSSTYISKRFL